jgi:hypothetical protein
MSEYAIVIVPASTKSPHDTITVEYRPDRESARIDAEFIAELIEKHGSVSALDGDILVGMVSRVGQARWRVRLDSFEFEMETRSDEGYGYLCVREVF